MMSWPSKGDESFPARTAGWMAVILLAGLALRVVGADRWSLWFDEIYTIGFRSQASLSVLLFESRDPHPPLYYITVRVWSIIFGVDPLSVRLLTVLFSGGALVAMYFLGRELYDARTGLLAALLMAVAPIQIHYGWMARMYGLLILLTTLSIYYFLKLNDRDAATWVFYILTTAGLLATHVFGIFVLLAQNFYVFFDRSDDVIGVSIHRWLTLQVVVAILSLPWGIHLGRQLLTILIDGTENGVSPIDWVPDPSLTMVWRTFQIYAGNPELYPILAGTTATAFIAVVVLMVYGISLFGLVTTDAWASRAARQRALFLAVLALTPIAVPFLLSLIVFPIFYPRFTIVATVPIYLLVARGIENVPVRGVQLGIVTFLVVTSLWFGGLYFTTETQEPFEESIEFIEQQPDVELIVVEPDWLIGSGEHFHFYYDGNAVLIGMPETGPTADDISRLEGALSPDQGICVFQYQASPDSEVVHETILESHHPVTRYEQGEIAVNCY